LAQAAQHQAVRLRRVTRVRSTVCTGPALAGTSISQSPQRRSSTSGAGLCCARTGGFGTGQVAQRD
jgi:hypothetical protein